MKVFVVLSAIFALAVAAPSVSENSDASSMRKILASCLENDEMFTCLSVKGITALNRAARSANIDVIPGVSFNRYKNKRKKMRSWAQFNCESNEMRISASRKLSNKIIELTDFHLLLSINQDKCVDCMSSLTQFLVCFFFSLFFTVEQRSIGFGSFSKGNYRKWNCRFVASRKIGTHKSFVRLGYGFGHKLPRHTLIASEIAKRSITRSCTCHQRRSRQIEEDR